MVQTTCICFLINHLNYCRMSFHSEKINAHRGVISQKKRGCLGAINWFNPAIVFIGVPVTSQQREWTYISVSSVSNLPPSTTFLLHFKIIPTVWNFFSRFVTLCNVDVKGTYLCIYFFEIVRLVNQA